MDQPKYTSRKEQSSRDAPRIVLVDQHAILRDGLSALLQAENHAQVVGDADSVAAARRLIEAADPDLVITDIAVRNESTIPLIAWLGRSHADVKVLVLSAGCSHDTVQAALDAGADGYILKDASKAELLKATRSVLAGEQYVSGEVAMRTLTGVFDTGTRARQDGARPLLTTRERQILKMIALADSTKAIASRLNVSVKTVEKHRANMMKKLQLKNSAAVVLYAVRHGMISIDMSSDETSAAG